MLDKKFYQKLYIYDKISKKYLIDVSLDDYNDVYDEWDPSPFKRRDIEEEFNHFIVNSSEDIPLKFDIGIVLYLPASKKDEKRELTLISAYKNYYEYIMQKESSNKSHLTSRILFNLFFSFTLLFIGYFFFKTTENIFLEVFKEGIFIGGWVFLWEFFTSMFYTRHDLNNEYKLFRRLYKADISFVYLD